jgi:hypothetical protein
MACKKCGGLLQSIDYEEVGSPKWHGARCVNCGNITDSVIESNRKEALAGVEPRQRRYTSSNQARY